MDIEEITNSIKSKLGEEESGKIADDLANLLIRDKSLYSVKDNMRFTMWRVAGLEPTLIPSVSVPLHPWAVVGTREWLG